MEPQSVTIVPSPTEPRLRACASCARAKVKCIGAGQDAGGKCDRCHRLKRLCEPSLSQLRAQARKRRVAISTRVAKSHVEKLEEKLDGLVALVKSTRDLTWSSIENRDESQAQLAQSRHTGLDSASQRRGTSNSSFQTETATLEIASPARICFSDTGSTSKAKHFQATELNIHITPEEADRLLSIFRSEMSDFFPFVVISHTLLASELRQDSPFLFLAVLTVSSRDPSQRRDFEAQFLKRLGERLFELDERNLDMLLGILTYVGWSLHLLFNVERLTALMTTAMALVYDLKLNQAPMNALRKGAFYEQAIRESLSDGKIASERNAEECRAVLGTFFMSSVVSDFFHRGDGLRLTAYLEECLAKLGNPIKYPADEYASSIVKLQKIAEEIRKSPSHGGADAVGLRAPARGFIQSIEKQLKDISRECNDRFRRNEPGVSSPNFKDPVAATVWIHYYHVEILLYKIGLSRLPQQGFAADDEFWRVELLHACLNSTKSFFDIVYSVFPAHYYHLTTPTLMHMTSSLITLQNLSVFEHPDWNLKSVHQVIRVNDVVDYFDKAVTKLAIDSSPNDQAYANIDTLFLLTKKMSCIGAWLKKHMPDNNQPSYQAPKDCNATETGMNEISEAIDVLDEAWLQELLYTWD